MGQRRTQVLHTAIDLLDEVGLDGLTMRLLADRLGVRASALYRHYPSKQALLDAMVAHLVTPPDAGATLDGPWDHQLRAVAHGIRHLMLAHRDGARLIAGFHDPGEHAVASFHPLIDPLPTAGAPPATAMVAVDTVLAYVNGYTTEEQARATDPGAPSRPQRDQAFHDGLDLIITGIRTHLTTTKPPA
ncbi:TetR/AcrR family transcriptional regulator C-terminal domain-containing protein [Nonomuraea sp. 3-1Str]|uniref:TetR/AcrR family transcriptional regulator C-terminal domain-containing protein n=1 Tax=Nonomuraea sp. 3-1Str TaxID=2929801 RepID=UPI00285EBDD7|nr:TetR/AcrR family transcriptional regulator C-terminal domain-containing protein [Nonomuraea sp. 3-1Str]MDR8414834.1 TetR/AcrR family transcriptional regulator C-terminal domain-containing protein [Nonomuraea sp. 3-1Str]